MTHAIVARQSGGPEVLELAEVDRPVPGPGQLLIKVAAVGVNFIDTYKRSGVYKVQYPFTPGSEASGTVEETGDGVTGFSAVTGWRRPRASNCYAGYALVDADKALPVPRGRRRLHRCRVPLQGITAHYLINSSFKVQAGHTVLLHAGAGGVGLLLIQLLKARGANVITTVSTDEKEALAREAGADHVLRYDGFAAKVRELTGGAGAHVVYDGVGKDNLRRIAGCPPDPRHAGALRRGLGSGAAVRPAAVERRGLAVLDRPTITHFLRDAQERRWRSDELFAAVADGSLKVRIGARYDLADAATAHTDWSSGRTTGKVILVP